MKPRTDDQTLARILSTLARRMVGGEERDMVANAMHEAAQRIRELAAEVERLSKKIGTTET